MPQIQTRVTHTLSPRDVFEGRPQHVRTRLLHLGGNTAHEFQDVERLPNIDLRKYEERVGAWWYTELCG
jgi:hypothetical protein